MSLRRTLVVAATVVAAMAIGAAAAAADPAVRSYKSTGSVLPVPGGATRVAVEPGTGNILVVDGSAITVLAPDGTQLATVPVSGPAVGLAIDQGSGAVYYAESSGAITRYTSDGAPTPTYTADGTFTSPPTGSGTGEIGSIAGIAVDPSTHDILVVDPTNDRVSRFSAAGTYVSAFSGASAPSAGFASATDIAVGPSGEILVVAGGYVDRFTAAGVSNGALAAAPTEPGAPAPAPTNVAINPTTGGIIVIGDGGFFAVPSLRFYDDSAASPSVVPYTAQGSDASFGAWPAGIAIDGTSSRAYGIYVGVIGGSALGIEVFDAGVVPGADLLPASGVDATSMHLHGTVDSGENGTLPAGVVEGVAHFVLTAPGLPTVQTPDQTYAATVGAQPIDAVVTGLVPNTDYSVKLVAQNSLFSGESTASTITTGLSAPTAVTGNATDITGSSAVLHGSITAYGLQTTYVFEYGPTTAYGAKAPAGAPGIFGISRTSRPVQRAIEGLQPGVTYHYRLVATNSFGTTAGTDATFTASPADSARGFEMVTPTDKGGGAIDTGFGFQARSDGDALLFQPTSAFATVEPDSSILLAKYLSRRASGGWNLPWQVDPPVATVRSTLGTTATTLGVSEDFSHALVVSNRKLTPDALPIDATGGGLNIYVRDTSNGSYRYVGGNATVPSFVAFVEVGQNSRYLGGSDDFSSVFFESPVPLTPDAPPNGSIGIYRWTPAAGLVLISRLPNGTAALGVVQRSLYKAIQSVSSDARRVVFSVNGTAQDDGLYLWEDGHVRALSVSHRPGDPATVFPVATTSYPPGLSRDGRYVTFTIVTADPLTPDATATPNNIYRLDLSGPGQGPLELVANEGGGVVIVSEDGSHVYYNGQPTPSDPVGWYVWTPGSRQYVTSNQAPATPTFLSPNGKYLAFSSPEQLTSYNNQFRNQLYYYNSVDNQLSCASCPKNGEPVESVDVPAVEIAVSNRYPRVVLDDGRAFFGTDTRVTAGDINNRRDVYSYRNGQATLISPGTGPYAARFMDASKSGRDVFFATNQALSNRDLDEEYDFYDARVGGGDPLPESPAPCAGDECADPPAVGSGGGSPGSESASGRQVASKAARARITKIGSFASHGSVRLTVRLSKRGRIRASGRGVRTTASSAAGAGTYTLVVPLGRKARKAQRERRRMKVTIRVSLTPSFGRSTSTKFSLTLGK